MPIADDDLADRAIELFLAGYDPLLFAADLGLSPETVFAQIRTTLRIYIEKAQRLSRKGRAGRRPLGKRAMTASERKQRQRAKK